MYLQPARCCQAYTQFQAIFNTVTTQSCSSVPQTLDRNYTTCLSVALINNTVSCNLHNVFTYMYYNATSDRKIKITN